MKAEDIAYAKKNHAQFAILVEYPDGSEFLHLAWSVAEKREIIDELGYKERVKEIKVIHYDRNGDL